jgi:predicted outer membrane repeat protein
LFILLCADFNALAPGGFFCFSGNSCAREGGAVSAELLPESDYFAKLTFWLPAILQAECAINVGGSLHKL